MENFAYGEINERSFSNPHPRALVVPLPFKLLDNLQSYP